MVKISRTMPPTPVAALERLDCAGWLCDSILKATPNLLQCRSHPILFPCLDQNLPHRILVRFFRGKGQGLTRILVGAMPDHHRENTQFREVGFPAQNLQHVFMLSGANRAGQRVQA